MKNVLYFSVNVLSKKILIGDTILRLLPETGPPLYVVIRATRRSCRLQGKCSTFIFLDPECWSDPKDQTRDLALCSQTLYQLFELVLPAVYCSSDQNTGPQAFLNPLRKVLPVLLTYVRLGRKDLP